MTRLTQRFSLLLLTLVLSVMAAVGQTQPPRIFFTDLVSGPNTGGENNNGVIVTIYGKRFGAIQGTSTVTFGGGAVAAVKSWSDTKIAVALGLAAQTGNIVVTVAGVPSNGIPFTVRTGNIYCVSTTGNNANPGTFSGGCWATITFAKNRMIPGDTTYVLNGVSQTTMEDINAAVSISPARSEGVSGTASMPIALVAYPGATVTIGVVSGIEYGIRMIDNLAFWTIAGFNVRGFNVAIEENYGANNIRIIGNDLTCPNGDGGTACAEGSQVFNIKFHGNTVHDAGRPGASKQYHGVYYSTDANHIEIGWNTVSNVRGCRGVQFHSSPLPIPGTGLNQFDLIVHDNVIHDTVCDGINFATVDPSKGPVEAYNNIVYSVGKGPDPFDGSSNYACVFSADGTNNGTPGTGNIEIYNNTFYNCGPRALANASGCYVKDGSNQNLYMRLRNNICYQVSPEVYVDSGLTGQQFLDRVIGSNNLWFGVGNGPSWPGLNPVTNVNADPLFASLSSFNFQLLSTSPAIDRGVNTPAATDIFGVSRPQGAAYDVGAFEFPSGGTVQRPNPPTNLRVVVVR